MAALGRLPILQYEEDEVVVDELLRMPEPDFYDNATFKLLPRWGKCINVLGVYVVN
jgi:hypothetical protein